jgi:hypothetical protein
MTAGFAGSCPFLHSTSTLLACRMPLVGKSKVVETPSHPLIQSTSFCRGPFWSYSRPSGPQLQGVTHQNHQQSACGRYARNANSVIAVRLK